MAMDLEREYFPGFTDAAQEALQRYHWPGNIRELKNAVERSVYRSGSPDAAVDLISIDPFESEFRPVRSNEADTTGEEIVREPGFKDVNTPLPTVAMISPSTSRTASGNMKSA